MREEISIPPYMGSMLSGIYDTYLFAVDANVEKFLSVLEGVDLYIVDDDFKKEVEEQRILIRTLIRKRLKSSDIDTVLDAGYFEGSNFRQGSSGDTPNTFDNAYTVSDKELVKIYLGTSYADSIVVGSYLYKKD